MYYTCISNGNGGWAKRYPHYTELEARLHRDELIIDFDFDEDAVFIEYASETWEPRPIP